MGRQRVTFRFRRLDKNRCARDYIMTGELKRIPAEGEFIAKNNADAGII